MKREIIPTKLHLGAFNSSVEGWLNTDITPHIFIARVPYAPLLLWKAGMMTADRFDEHKRGIFKKLYYLDVTKPFPLPSNHFSSVFSSHVLEHISPWRIPNLLTSILRVLRPGGIVRFAVPDLDFYVKLYSKENPDTMLAAFFDQHGRGLEKNHHKWMYTESSLAALLERFGFIDVRPCAYREGRCEDLNVIDNRPEDSIYVEGAKPGLMEK
jgi:SAM-dependent methyltransferase